MNTEQDLKWNFDQHDHVGIFAFSGELTHEFEDDLKLLLMRAIHGNDRAVLNFNKVTMIDRKCIQLLRKAYCTSLRLNNPLILTEVPKAYLDELFNCDAPEYSIS